MKQFSLELLEKRELPYSRKVSQFEIQTVYKSKKPPRSLNHFSHNEGYCIVSSITYLVPSKYHIHYFPHYSFLINVYSTSSLHKYLCLSVNTVFNLNTSSLSLMVIHLRHLETTVFFFSVFILLGLNKEKKHPFYFISKINLLSDWLFPYVYDNFFLHFFYSSFIFFSQISVAGILHSIINGISCVFKTETDC